MPLALVALLLILLGACGGGSTPPTAPPPPQPPEVFPRTPADIPVRGLRLGDSIAVDRNSSIERFVYVTPRAERLALYSTCSSGDIVLRRVPSLAAPISQVIFISPGVCGRPLLSTWMIEAVAAGDSLIIEVNKLAGTSGIRLALVRQDTLPEQGPQRVVVGDTLAGVLEHPADQDVVEVSPPGPGTYVLYAQSNAPAGAAPLRVNFEAPADGNGAAINGALRDPDLESLRSQRILLRSGSGIARLRIRADLGATTPGPIDYRVHVRRVNPAPESGPARVTIGALRAGALEHSADVDFFEAQLSDSSRYVLFLRHLSGPASGRMGIWQPIPLDDSTLAIAQVRSRLGDPSRFGTAVLLRDVVSQEQGAERIAFAVAPARDRSPSDAGVLQIDRGAYEFEVARINQAPERAPVVLRLNDSVTVERLDTPLDLDRFALVGTYDRAAVYLRSPTGSIGARFGDGEEEIVERLPGEPVFVGRPAPPLNPGDTAFVGVNSDAQQDGDVVRFYDGPYVLAFREIRPAPETASPVLVANTITSEALDFPGDLDNFSYTATERQRVRVRFAGAFFVRVNGNVLTLAPTPASGDLVDIGDVIELAAGETLRLEIVPPRGGSSLRDAGPYRLQVVRLP